MTLRCGVLTVSDRSASGEMEDRGGPAVAESLRQAGWSVTVTEIVPDDVSRIGAVLRRWADVDEVDAIFTTGGTGLGPRDTTPEATADVIERSVPGIAEAIRSASLAQTPQAMLSRGLAGARGRTLIINLPGSPRGATFAVDVVRPVLEHAVAVLRGGKH